MRKLFPDAKTFGATRSYFADLHTDHVKREHITENAKAANVATQLESEEQRRRAIRHDELEAEWNERPETERGAIRDSG